MTADEDAGPKSYKQDDAAKECGIWRVHFQRGRALGLIPAPDADGGRWSQAVVADLAARAEELTAQIAARQPLGATRIAEALAERIGTEVVRADVEELAERGLLTEAGDYKGWPLYDPQQAAAIPAETVAEVVAERKVWLEASLTTEEATTKLGWRRREFERVAAERLTAGRDGRWARADVQALAEDEELCARVEADRLLGPEQAAAHLEIRRVDLDYLVAGGLLEAAETSVIEVGVRSEVEVAMYRTADLEDLREVPGIDWEELRTVERGAPSPLREIVPGLPPTRAQLIRAFAADLGDRHGVEVWPRYIPGPQVWEIDWEQRGDGTPTLKQVKAALADHPAAAHAGSIHLSTAAGRVIRWARAAIEPSAAVVLDTETTGLAGAIVEITILDAATGEVLLDTLVHPGDVAVEPGARAVHGITDAELEGAPAWPQVWPKLVKAVGERQLVSYNAEFDRSRIIADCDRCGIDPGRLGDAGSWACAMEARSDYLRLGHWIPLGGNHRARGDAQATLDLMRAMTAAPVRPPRRR